MKLYQKDNLYEQAAKILNEAKFNKGDKVLVKNTNPNGTLKYDAFGGKFVHGIVKIQTGSKVDIKRMGDLQGNPPQKTYLGSVGSMTVDATDVILDTSGKNALKLRKLLKLLEEDTMEEGLNTMAGEGSLSSAMKPTHLTQVELKDQYTKLYQQVLEGQTEELEEDRGSVIAAGKEALKNLGIPKNEWPKLGTKTDRSVSKGVTKWQFLTANGKTVGSEDDWKSMIAQFEKAFKEDPQKYGLTLPESTELEEDSREPIPRGKLTLKKVDRGRGDWYQFYVGSKPLFAAGADSPRNAVANLEIQYKTDGIDLKPFWRKSESTELEEATKKGMSVVLHFHDYASQKGFIKRNKIRPDEIISQRKGSIEIYWDKNDPKWENSPFVYQMDKPKPYPDWKESTELEEASRSWVDNKLKSFGFQKIDPDEDDVTFPFADAKIYRGKIDRAWHIGQDNVIVQLEDGSFVYYAGWDKKDKFRSAANETELMRMVGGFGRSGVLESTELEEAKITIIDDGTGEGEGWNWAQIDKEEGSAKRIADIKKQFKISVKKKGKQGASITGDKKDILRFYQDSRGAGLDDAEIDSKWPELFESTELEEAKTIKVGEDSVGAESTTYALVKERMIMAMGEKDEMLELSSGKGGRVWLVNAERRIGNVVESVELTEAKLTAREMVKIMSNAADWGPDMKDKVYVKGSNMVMVDSYYYNGSKALMDLEKNWDKRSGGSYWKYFNDEYGVDIKVVDSFTEINAEGRHKKVTKDGIVGVELKIN